MTREDTMKILATVQAAYPNYKPNDKTAALNTWWTLLQEYSYEQVSLALKAYIQTDVSGFAPAIGQVIATINRLFAPEALNDMEAWALVSRALRNGYYGSEAEFEKLPPLVQQAVGCPDNLRHWSQSELTSIETVIQSNFVRTYHIIVQREQEKQKMSLDLQNLIDNANCEKMFCISASRPEAVVDDVGPAVPMPEKMKEKLEKELLSN